MNVLSCVVISYPCRECILRFQSAVPRNNSFITVLPVSSPRFITSVEDKMIIWLSDEQKINFVQPHLTEYDELMSHTEPLHADKGTIQRQRQTSSRQWTVRMLGDGWEMMRVSFNLLVLALLYTKCTLILGKILYLTFISSSHVSKFSQGSGRWVISGTGGGEQAPYTTLRSTLAFEVCGSLNPKQYGEFLGGKRGLHLN